MSKPSFRNVPPPPEGARPATPYSRFIPREELGEFEAWNPGALLDTGDTPAGDFTATAPNGASQVPTTVAAARASGYQDGYRDGLVALEGFKQSFAAQMASQVGKLLDNLNLQFDALEDEMAQAVAGSALLLARQVVRSELKTNPELVAKVAAEAVNAVLMSARHLTLQVHPLDLPLVEQGAAEALAARDARLVANEKVERGGCLVQSDLGGIDARIATRWAQAAAALGQNIPLQDEPSTADTQGVEVTE